MRRGILTGRRRDGSGATIEIAPLIDIVFILLIFYIVSTSFVRDSAVSVTRPTSKFAGPVKERYVSVTLTAEGTVYVDGVAAPRDRTAHIAAALNRADVRTVLIRSDADAATGMLLKVMDICRDAGAEAVLVGAVEEADK